MTREALALDRRMFGDHHSNVAEGLANLGWIYTMRGRFKEADSTFRESLKIDLAVFGDGHERIAKVYSQLSVVNLRAGNVAAAARFARQSLMRYRALFGEKHVYTLAAMSNLAACLSNVGNAAEAESLARGALAGLDSADAANRPAYISAQSALGAAILRQHRADEALPILERAVQMSRHHLGDDHWRTGYARLLYGKALVSKGRVADAAPVLRAARATLEKQRVEQPHLAALAAAALVPVTARSGRSHGE
jgi:serine/threonine-protein kinase